jgi:hypothetical protein
MEFSRAVAHACFKAAMWLMVVTGTLFLLLAAVQYWRGETNAEPALTIGTGMGCLLLALLLRHFARRMLKMNGS